MIEACPPSSGDTSSAAQLAGRRAPAVGAIEVRHLATTLNEALKSNDRAQAALRAARDDLKRRNYYVEQVLDTLAIAVAS